MVIFNSYVKLPESTVIICVGGGIVIALGTPKGNVAVDEAAILSQLVAKHQQVR